jgi:hypothetical protein
MGAFVDKVPDRSWAVTPGSPWELITERIDNVQAYANDWSDTLEQAVNDLQNGVGAYSQKYGMPSGSIPSLEEVAFPNAPVTNLNLNTGWPDPSSIPVPSTRAIPTGGLDYEEPDEPEEILSDFNFVPDTFTECTLPPLCDRVKDVLINGGTGLTDAVHSAIIERDREARRRSEDRFLSEALDTAGERGLDLPGGTAAALMLEANAEVFYKDRDAANSVMIKDFDLADANEKFNKELALKIEEFRAGRFDSREQLLFESAKVVKDIAVSIFEMRVKKYLAQWDGIKAKLEAAKALIDAISKENDGKIKEYLGRIDAVKAQISAIAEENKSRTEVEKAKADIYDSTIRGLSAKQNALIQKVAFLLEKYKTDVDSAAKFENLNLEAFKSTSALSAQISTSIANIASQAVASALGAVHAQMSYGYSGHESKTSSYGLSNNLSESHSYEES